MKRRRPVIVATVSFFLAFGVIGAWLGSPYLLEPLHHSQRTTNSSPAPQVKNGSEKYITGKPVRIVLASSSIDLPVVDGIYNRSSKTWTLYSDKAMYATFSKQPNNKTGMTFIYGHGTDKVFGKIGRNHPSVGSIAEIYTDNNRVFTYSLTAVEDLKPADTWILKNRHNGPPHLIIQTCTGAYSQWRTMFEYSYKSVR